MIVNDLGFCVRIESQIVSASFCASNDMLIGVFFSPERCFLVGNGGGLLVLVSGLVFAKSCCFGEDFINSPAIAFRFSEKDFADSASSVFARELGGCAGLCLGFGFVGGLGLSGDVVFLYALGVVFVVILVFSSSLGLSLFILTGGGGEFTGLGSKKHGFGGLGLGGLCFGGLGFGGLSLGRLGFGGRLRKKVCSRRGSNSRP